MRFTFLFVVKLCSPETKNDDYTPIEVVKMKNVPMKEALP